MYLYVYIYVKNTFFIDANASANGIGKKEFPKCRCRPLNENGALFYFIFAGDSGVKAAKNPS